MGAGPALGRFHFRWGFGQKSGVYALLGFGLGGSLADKEEPIMRLQRLQTRFERWKAENKDISFNYQACSGITGQTGGRQ